MSGIACPQCKRTDSFYQEGTVPATRGVTVEVGDNGRASFTYGTVEDGPSWDFESMNTYAECECGYTLRQGDEIPGDPEDDPTRPEVGDVVVCPDGLKGRVAAVDGYTVTVDGWHERFKSTELNVVHPVKRAAA